MAESRPSISPRTNRSPKRSSSSAGLKEKPHRPTKRRASKACQCCRSRKVRCNVVEHGPPCTNCRLDEVECIITESKRKRKSLPKIEDDSSSEPTDTPTNPNPPTKVNETVLDAITNLGRLPTRHNLQGGLENHIPHPLYRSHSDKTAQGEPSTRPSISSTNSAPGFGTQWTTSTNPSVIPKFGPTVISAHMLPFYVKPIPSRFGADEIEYLEKKGAFSIPTYGLRDELCRSYIEFVHPYMPLINIHEFLRIMQKGDGGDGKISLLLFQAIIFAGSAFVNLNSLKKAGFSTRKEARRVFFQRVRLLYDFDYEVDRFAQVQTLLLMTSWYETSDDKKDAWHWMGIAIATAYTIGLHRNPAISNMDSEQQKLWKRVWWACVIRDRLIALGARRPIRIKSEDCDVPMLTLEDFDLGVMPDSITCIPHDCKVIRDVQMQTSMAIICIEKAKLCMCISDVLATQYSIQRAPNTPGPQDMRTAAVLSPKPFDPDATTVTLCHQNLENWKLQLPESLEIDRKLTKEDKDNSVLVVHKAILHLVYFAALSALHRPQVLHGNNIPSKPREDNVSDTSREYLRYAALETTKIATTLLDLGLVQYLPTTGVTVLQPAIISHLLDIKSPDEQIRRTALHGFCQCIDAMSRLRDCYTAADHSIALVEAAIRRADIKIPTHIPSSSGSSPSASELAPERTAKSAEDLVDVGKRENLIPSIPPVEESSPDSDSEKSEDESNEASEQPDQPHPSANLGVPPTDYEIARKLELFLASTPLEPERPNVPAVDYLTCIPVSHYTYDNDFDAFIDFSSAGPESENQAVMYDDNGNMQLAQAPLTDSALGSTPDWDTLNMNPSGLNPHQSQDMSFTLPHILASAKPTAQHTAAIPQSADLNATNVSPARKAGLSAQGGLAAGVRVVA